jgi:hypothetical protein|tara:strand:- start:563 stop:769 length:207 start_codon:yes stop_codon:yes gene_type:complete
MVALAQAVMSLNVLLPGLEAHVQQVDVMMGMNISHAQIMRMAISIVRLIFLIITSAAVLHLNVLVALV